MSDETPPRNNLFDLLTDRAQAARSKGQEQAARLLEALGGALSELTEALEQVAGNDESYAIQANLTDLELNQRRLEVRLAQIESQLANLEERLEQKRPRRPLRIERRSAWH